MKKISLLLAILFSIVSFAKNSEPKLEVVGNLVKATYYYDNGTIQQEGFFKDGKLDGKWTSYDVAGKITLVATYTDGLKSGKWIYFTNAKESQEVVYQNNEIKLVNKLNPIAKN